MSIRGVVVDAGIHPLNNATVTILETNQTLRVSPGGLFRFEGLRPDTYILTARATSYRAQTLSVTPETAKDELRFQLDVIPGAVTYNETARFHGNIQCALEVLILSPSCDSVLTIIPGAPSVFNTTSNALLPVEDGWRTVVVDVVFDPAAQPAMDGLRVTTLGSHNASSLGNYQQYGRFHDAKPFTFRIEPGQNYTDDTAGPVPSNTTVFRFEVLPQSIAWHAVCVPPGSATCFLGVGVGHDVSFDLYITTFYGKPAPTGFTLRK